MAGGRGKPRPSPHLELPVLHVPLALPHNGRVGETTEARVLLNLRREDVLDLEASGG